jgi:predicted MFS family arabinose efflux permease
VPQIDARDRPHVGLPAGLLALMAVGSGLSAANNYYVQPLLHLLTRDFGVSTAVGGMLVTVGQVGYVLGLAFIVPLGDLVDRRMLVTVVAGLTALSLVAVGLAPNLGVLMGFILLTGICSVGAQILVPFAAHLADPIRRGRSVSVVMSGLLIGVLLARTVSGLLARAAGWRSVYLVAAGVMFGLSVCCYVRLPKLPPATRTSYRRLLGSILTIVREEPVLRRRCAYGMLSYGSFGVFWTSMSFMMADRYHYDEATIGLFGLLGAAGAMCAQLAGRIADAGWARLSTAGFLLSLAISWPLLYQGRDHLWAVVVGIIVFDLGVQGTHISNQSEIYRLRPDARGRLTTSYMCSYFLGGVTGSTLSALAYSSGGWKAVCLLGLAYPTVALLFLLTEVRWPLSRMRHREEPTPVRRPREESSALLG